MFNAVDACVLRLNLEQPKKIFLFPLTFFEFRPCTNPPPTGVDDVLTPVQYEIKVVRRGESCQVEASAKSRPLHSSPCGCAVG